MSQGSRYVPGKKPTPVRMSHRLKYGDFVVTVSDDENENGPTGEIVLEILAGGEHKVTMLMDTKMAARLADALSELQPPSETDSVR